jgi:hypothetical protein
MEAMRELPGVVHDLRYLVLRGDGLGSVDSHVAGRVHKEREVMKIEVTEANIKNGEPRDCTRCAIALAVKRANHWKYAVEVNGDQVVIGGRVWRLPEKAIEFIDRFDRGMDVSPNSFNLSCGSGY